jgi:hypothetical protein
MRKIPTVFKRDPDDMSRVLREVNPVAQWVLDGEGVPTRKFDGTCVLLSSLNDSGEGVGGWWARREVKPGKPMPTPYWIEEADPNTGKTVGWVPIGESSFVKPFEEAVGDFEHVFSPGTYELCGPKVNGNPEGFDRHALVRHGDWHLKDVPLDYDGLRDWLLAHDFEGIVWHHADGRMAKLKRRDVA